MKYVISFITSDGKKLYYKPVLVGAAQTLDEAFKFDHQQTANAVRGTLNENWRSRANIEEIVNNEQPALFH